jgi:hypothetical protein
MKINDSNSALCYKDNPAGIYFDTRQEFFFGAVPQWTYSAHPGAVRTDAEDEYKFIVVNSRKFSEKLTAAGIPHTFEEYNGDTTGTGYGD